VLKIEYNELKAGKWQKILPRKMSAICTLSGRKQTQLLIRYHINVLTP